MSNFEFSIRLGRNGQLNAVELGENNDQFEDLGLWRQPETSYRIGYSNNQSNGYPIDYFNQPGGLRIEYSNHEPTGYNTDYQSDGYRVGYPDRMPPTYRIDNSVQLPPDFRIDHPDQPTDYTTSKLGQPNGHSYEKLGGFSHPTFGTCELVHHQTLSYDNGTKASVRFTDDGKNKVVEEFVSADGVKYKRVELNEQERGILSTKLGHNPEPGYAAWVVEGGGIGKSNGNSNHKIIAKVDFDACDHKVSVKTVWPVPQSTEYLGDGSFIHKFPHGARERTGKVHGTTVQACDTPGSDSIRWIFTEPDGERKILDRKKHGGQVTDVTERYETW
ncbi:hypothetical protein BH10CYA1_BH10CYA1_61690 [soil metagenome]